MGKGEGEVWCTAEKLMDTITTPSTIKKVERNLKSVEIVQAYGDPTNKVRIERVYYKYKPFLLFCPRDFILSLLRFESPSGHQYLVAHSVECDTHPKRKHYVRGNCHFALWEVKNIPETHKCFVTNMETFDLKCNMGGFITKTAIKRAGLKIKPLKKFI